MPARRRSHRTRPLLAALALTAATVAGAAAEGYYDAYGNWVDLAPPARIYRAPPVYAAPPRDGGPIIVYAEPPAIYDDVPLEAPPRALGRRLLERPGEDVPVPRGYRLLRRGALSPEFRDDPRDLAVAPDDGYDPPAVRRLEQRRQALQAPPVIEPGDDGWRAAPSAVPRSEARILHVEPAPDAGVEAAPPAEGGPAILRPNPEQRSAVNLSRALDALAVYAPAKKAAVKLDDAADRNAAMKKANAWLVTASALPATPATIRALDKLLGIPVDKDSTALPGAGTSVEKPKVGKPADVSALEGRLRSYADTRVRNGTTPPLMFGEGGKKLDGEELAGLDLFLGIRPAGNVVAETNGR